ncbi:unnamed protein product [Symbiodinium natans]|uniref:Uncharacterized protein n=1 Tax=Symbiodinium natans TaxID=878477 RepID=A0A812U239_9DINO|nr:unnamed protein product [Symbiodinium natans]
MPSSLKAQEEAMQLLVGKYKVLPAACRDSAGNNALHLCSRSGNHTMAGLLLEQWGGSVADALTQLNAQGQTPREIASIQNFGRILRSFNAHCARHEIKIFEGHVGKPRAASSGLTCFPFNVCCIAASSEALEFQF